MGRCSEPFPLLKCYACGAAMREQPIRLEERIGSVHVVVENMPAHVCPECGEEVGDGTALVALERHVESLCQRGVQRQRMRRGLACAASPPAPLFLRKRQSMLRLPAGAPGP